MTPKIFIQTMEAMENRAAGSVGSSRIRGTWLLNHWPEARPFKIGEACDVVIYQKAYNMEHMRAFKGIKLFDLCDPDWLNGRSIREVTDHVDAMTCPTEPLAHYLRQMTDKPVVVIPDRVDLTEYPRQKDHNGPAKTVVWYGYVDNHKVLDQCLSAIKRLGLKLVVISNQPYFPDSAIAGIDDAWMRDNVRNLTYDQQFFADDMLANGDICLNPRIESGRFRFKSENKTVISWALGIPVAKTGEDLERFMDAGERRKEADARLAEVREKWDVRTSVREYKELIERLLTERAMHGAEQGGY